MKTLGVREQTERVATNKDRDWQPRSKAVVQRSRNTRSAGTGRLSDSAAATEQELRQAVQKRNAGYVGPKVEPTEKHGHARGSKGLAGYGVED